MLGPDFRNMSNPYLPVVTQTTYSATDIARRIVQLSIQDELWISNLKLQKILYFAWMDYYRDKKGARLFDDTFQAWKYGPVVPDVYYEYWLNVARLIFLTKAPSVTIDEDTSEFLRKELHEYHKYTAGKLVDMAHRDGSPWKQTYVEGRKEEIPFPLIEKAAMSSSVN